MRSPLTKVVKQRGDTIVEVLLSLAVLGAVLGGAYVVVNRNTTVNRMAQERLEAVKLAETQFERLKVAAVSNPAVFHWNGNFCVSADETKKNGTACKVDANGNSAADPELARYQISINRVTNINLNGNPQAGVRYKVNVTWDSVRGSDVMETMDYYYEVYR